MNREMLLIYQQIIAPWVAAGAGGVTITPLHYTGLRVGSEFLTYDIDKYYLAINMGTGGNTLIANEGVITFFDFVNAAIDGVGTEYPFFNTVTGVQQGLPRRADSHNIHFSRVTVNRATFLTFNGYRINRV